jgi:hypothetical protein
MENQKAPKGQVEGTKWKTRRDQRDNQKDQKGHKNVKKW